MIRLLSVLVFVMLVVGCNETSDDAADVAEAKAQEEAVEARERQVRVGERQAIEERMAVERAHEERRGGSYTVIPPEPPISETDGVDLPKWLTVEIAGGRQLGFRDADFYYIRNSIGDVVITTDGVFLDPMVPFSSWSDTYGEGQWIGWDGVFPFVSVVTGNHRVTLTRHSIAFSSSTEPIMTADDLFDRPLELQVRDPERGHGVQWSQLQEGGEDGFSIGGDSLGGVWSGTNVVGRASLGSHGVRILCPSPAATTNQRLIANGDTTSAGNGDLIVKVTDSHILIRRVDVDLSEPEDPGKTAPALRDRYPEGPTGSGGTPPLEPGETVGTPPLELGSGGGGAGQVDTGGGAGQTTDGILPGGGGILPTGSGGTPPPEPTDDGPVGSDNGPVGGDNGPP